MPFFDFAHHKIHYHSHGEGETALLFIHGLGGDANSWKYQVECFQDKYEIITIDLIGHGRSSKDADPVRAPRIDAEAAVNLMQTIIKKPYFLVGHSFATNINPEIIKIGDPLLKGVVFVDCTYQGFQNIINIRMHFSEKMLRLNDNALKTETPLWYDDLIGPGVTSEDRQLIHSSLENCDLRWLFESVAGCRQFCSDYPPEETPVDDSLPIFIMEAENGVGADIHKSWVNHFKNARYYLFENAGHFFFITERKIFNRLLNEFVKENR